MTIITRRNVLQGLIAAPAIIAIERLMKPKLWVPEPEIIKSPEFTASFVGGWLEVSTDPSFKKDVTRYKMNIDSLNGIMTANVNNMLSNKTYYYRLA